MLKNYKIYQLIIFGFCFLLIGFRMFNVSIYDDSRARNGILGDGFSDKNTVSSAKYFLDSGFTKTNFLPVHGYYPKAENAPQVYTHYPALPNILAGIYATLFNSVNQTVLRIIPVLLAVFFFFFIFYVLNQITKDQTKALIGSSIIILGNYFINYADNLHQHLYGELLKWVYFYLLYCYYEKNAKTNLNLFWLCLIMVAEVNISFEQPVFLGILTVGFSLIYQKNIFTKTTILSGLAVVLGFTLHLWQNALYLGSWQNAIDDLTKAYTFRATGAETVGYIKEADFSIKNAWQIPFDWFNRMERFYLIPGWALLVMSYWGLKAMRYQNKHLLKISWALFFASIAWTILMAQHGFVHGFTNKHFSIWVALVSAYALPAYYQKLKADLTKPANYLYKALHIILVAYILIMFFSQQVYEVWLKFALLYPYLGKN